MTNNELARQLPYLRRYARALAGSQAGGDACVRQLLCSLVEKRYELSKHLPIRLALYRAFHQVWTRCPMRAAADRQYGEAGVDRFLQKLDGEDRAAILLTAVEGFSVAETAIILSRTAREVEQEIAAALRSIDRELRARILIIEDEPIIALDLENLVEELGHIVAGVASTRDNALLTARSARPQLILSDLKLADGSSGADAAGLILEEMNVPVIFITAFPESLLTGNRPEPTYLVTKPFSSNEVSALIGQALLFHKSRLAA